MNASSRNESQHARFCEISHVLRWEPSQRIAMLWTYFDESGLHKKNPPGVLDWLVLGGAVATQNAWDSVVREWDKALDDAGIKVFHMVDFEANEGEFKKYKNDKANHQLLLNRLLDPITEHIRYVFGVANWKGRYKGIYREIHLACVNDIFKVSERIPTTYDDKISIVMAKHDEVKPKSVNDLYEAILGSNEWFSTCTIADVREFRGLQVADLLAYEMCRSIRDNGPERYPLKRIKEKADVRIFLCLEAASKFLAR